MLLLTKTLELRCLNCLQLSNQHDADSGNKQRNTDLFAQLGIHASPN
jgi:hypothetical protein